MLHSSCVPCRARKRKCDGLQPCRSCIERDEVRACKRDERKERRRKGGKSTIRTDDKALKTTTTTTTTQLQGDISAIWRSMNKTSVHKDLLDDIFFSRVYSLVFASIPFKRIRRILDKVFAESDFIIAQNAHSSSEIALASITIALCLQFSPTSYFRYKESVSAFYRDNGHDVERIKDELHKCSVRHCKQAVRNNHVDLTTIQAIIQLLCFQRLAETDQTFLWDTAYRSVCIYLTHEQTDGIRYESVLRSYWFLVAHSWLQAPISRREGVVALPTRDVPSLDRDWAFGGGHVDTKQRRQQRWTPIGYGLAMIKLTMSIRQIFDQGDFSVELVDLAFNRLAQSIDQPFRYDEGIDHAPLSPSPGAHFEPHDDLERGMVEQWLIHQQIFYAYLEFNTISSPSTLPTPTPTSWALAWHASEWMFDIDCPVVNVMHIVRSTKLRAAILLMIGELNAYSHTMYGADVYIGKAYVKRKIQSLLRQVGDPEAMHASLLSCAHNLASRLGIDWHAIGIERAKSLTTESSYRTEREREYTVSPIFLWNGFEKSLAKLLPTQEGFVTV